MTHHSRAATVTFDDSSALRVRLRVTRPLELGLGLGLWLGLKICCLFNHDVLFSYLDRRSTTYFHPTSTDCLSRVEFEWHLVSVSSGSGAHSTVGDSPAVRERRRVKGANSLSAVGYLFEERTPAIVITAGISRRNRASMQPLFQNLNTRQ